MSFSKDQFSHLFPQITGKVLPLKPPVRRGRRGLDERFSGHFFSFQMNLHFLQFTYTECAGDFHVAVISVFATKSATTNNLFLANIYSVQQPMRPYEVSLFLRQLSMFWGGCEKSDRRRGTNEG